MSEPTMPPLPEQTFFIKTLFYIMEEYRGIVNFLLVLPVSFAVDTVWALRDWFYENFATAAHLHDSRVARVQAQVREWRTRTDAGEKVGKMCTDRRPWLTMSPAIRDFKKECRKITVSDMCDILRIDEEKMTVTAEPLVNMGYLTRALVPRGFAMKVQVEMEDITLGGITMGLGMETDSHRHGLVQECIVSYDIVLASGECVHATRDNEHAELFACLPWSCGTLGLLVAVEVEMVHIKPYVKAVYVPTFSNAEHCKRLKELSLLPEGEVPQFLESTVYSKDRAVIQLCTSCDITWYEFFFKVNRVNLWFKPYYYHWLENAFERTNAQTGEPGFEELIPLRHYYHRYSRSIFWMLEDLIPFGNHMWYRYLFGWLGAPKPAVLKFVLTPSIREAAVTKQVVQDIILPMDDLADAVELFHKEWEIYPLLVFPIRIYDHGKHQGFLRRPTRTDGVDGPDGQHPGKVIRNNSTTKQMLESNYSNNHHHYHHYNHNHNFKGVGHVRRSRRIRRAAGSA
ncbi:hypothetical protein T492DRAFT_495224 [Pavlovales sp. CCMP2436]|nr:hypothetical protein T492DRAFT_495224 [Pavlovales sp. CCMP2436]